MLNIVFEEMNYYYYCNFYYRCKVKTINDEISSFIEYRILS